jgi:hypothetical protein
MQMGAGLSQIIEELKNAPLVIVVSVVLVLLSSLLTIANSFSLISGFYRRTIGSKRHQIAKRGRLAAGVNISFFENYLGPPAFITKIPAGKEYIFVHQNYYVQGITNEDDSVLAFFVTTRKSGFNPSFIVLGAYSKNGKPFRVKLGKTKFQKLSDLGKPDKCFYSLGAHRFSYYETWYFGNPGNYQTFFFALSDAGYARLEALLPIDMQGAVSIHEPKLIKFRRETFINTYGITTPHFLGNELDEVSIGPDHDQVRILGV